MDKKRWAELGLRGDTSGAGGVSEGTKRGDEGDGRSGRELLLPPPPPPPRAVEEEEGKGCEGDDDDSDSDCDARPPHVAGGGTKSGIRTGLADMGPGSSLGSALRPAPAAAVGAVTATDLLPLFYQHAREKVCVCMRMCVYVSVCDVLPLSRL